MKTLLSLLLLFTLPLICHAQTIEEPVTADGGELFLTIGPDGRAAYSQEFDQDPKAADHHSFAVEGRVTWRGKPWEDLAFSSSRVTYKVRLSKPVARLLLGASFWATPKTQMVISASPDGQTWTDLFTYDPATTALGGRMSRTVDLAKSLSRDRQPVVFIRLGAPQEWGLLHSWGLTAFEQLPPAVAPYKPGPVPPDGSLRYCIQYGTADESLLHSLQRARVNLLHWHGPFSGYNGLEPREQLPGLTRLAKDTIDRAHAAGMACILYIGPCFSYGDPVKRDLLFGFYDKRWQQYEDYFGKKPGDLLEMAQCDVQGKPRPYVYEGMAGYHLCVNSPGVRQMTKGLIRMIVEAGGDGSFYDGPYVTEGRCYCRWCREKFRQWLKDTYSPADLKAHFGVDDPATVEPPKTAAEKLWVPFRRFNVWSLQDFMRDTRDYGRSLNPHYIMTTNYCMWSGEPFSPIRGTAEDVESQSQVIDLIFDEAKYGAGPRWDGDKTSNSTDYRHLLAGARGKPVALLKTSPEGRVPEADANLTRLALAEGAANGGTFQLHRLKPLAMAAAEQYSAFLAEREGALTRCRPWSTVAIWTSSTQAYHDLATYPTAISRFLADNHVPHRMVIDDDITAGKLDEYRALIVPDVAVISDKQVSSLQRFAESGGGLILMGQCGRLDEWGDKRATLPLQQPATAPTEPALQRVGRGCLAVIPAMSLPQSPNDGLSAGDKAKLAALPGLLRKVTGRQLPAWAGAGEQLELTTGWDRKRTLLVSLLNYHVELTGHVQTLGPIPVKVALPPGLTVESAAVYTPDAGSAKGSALTCQTINPGDGEYATFVLPSLNIFSQVELKLKPAPPAKSVGAPLELALDGDAAPGGSVTLTATAPAAATWEAAAPAGWRMERTTPQPAQLQCRLLVPATERTSFGRVRLTAKLASGAALSDELWVPVLAALELGLRTPAYADTRSGRTRLDLTLRNRLSTPVDAEVRLAAPAGWSFGSNPVAVAVPAQATRQTTVWVTSPAGTPAGPVVLSGAAAAGDHRAQAEVTLTVLDNLQVLRCPKIATAPKLDGVLDDLCWQQAGIAGSFQRNDGKGNARQQTTARVCHDGQQLYVAFECRESEPETIINLVSADGGEVWRDDSVEVFLDPGVTRRGILHWVVNSAGKKYPGKWWQAAAGKTPQGWVIEAALPIGTYQPQAGDMWGINLCRTRPSRPQNEPEYSSWSYTGGSFHKPERFGVMIFDQERK